MTDEFKEIDSGTEKTSKVLVIVTGGTIIMQNENGNIEPEHDYLDNFVEKNPLLNDRSLRQKLPNPSNDLGNIYVLPRLTKLDKEVEFCIYRYQPYLDSSNMSLIDYKKIVKDIRKYYEEYDGFVILHGTDTMAYTASYLSFMFENLSKTVILTGAQIPLCAHRTDGVDNMIGSILLAGNYVIPECTLFFDHKLFRGNRTQKKNCEGFDAFISANMEPLVSLGVKIDVNYNLIRNPANPCIKVFLNMNEDVGLLHLFPGITGSAVSSYLQQPLKGAVIMTYGSGNGPSGNKAVMNAIEEAYKAEILMLNVTQCWVGSVNPVYETGNALARRGVVVGRDITPEAGLAKLSYVLGIPNQTFEQRKEMMKKDLRGEITLSKVPKSQTGDRKDSGQKRQSPLPKKFKYDL